MTMIITIWKDIVCSHAQEWIKLVVGLLCILMTHRSHRYLQDNSKCIKHCAEIVSVEITLSNSNKVIICCVYRAPNTDLSMLSEFLTNILRNVRKNTVYIIHYWITSIDNKSNHNHKPFKNVDR